MNLYIFKIRIFGKFSNINCLLIEIFVNLLWLALSLIIFSIIYKENLKNRFLNFEELCTYLWLQQIFSAFLISRLFDNSIFDDIKKLKFEHYLCKPISLYNIWFLRDTSLKFANVFCKIIPLLFVSTLLPTPFKILMPSDTTTLLLFIFSTFLSFMIVSSMNMLIYITAIHVRDVYGIKLLYTSINEFLAGAIIPFFFFPERMQQIIKFLPSYYIQNTPFYIYLSKIGNNEIISNILIQMFWAITLIFLGNVYLNKSIRPIYGACKDEIL